MTLTKKKIVALSVLLVLLVAAVVLAIVLRPRLTYRLSGDTSYYTVTGVEGLAVSVSIPKTYKGTPVKYIDNYAFQDQTFLRKISIPNGVKSIGLFAFQNCSNLREITIPDSVTLIKSNAFASCRSLHTVSFGKGLTEISDAAFYGCDALTSLTIPAEVRSIGPQAFYGCSSLVEVSLSEKVSLGAEAFAFCDNLCEISGSISELGRGVFWGTPLEEKSENWQDGILYILNCAAERSLPREHITVRDGTVAIADHLFDYSSIDKSLNDVKPIKSITLPSTLKHIGFEAFRNCDALTELIIPEGVETIDTYAFADCTKLSRVSLPSTVKQISTSAFDGCSAITHVTFAEGSKHIDGVLFMDSERIMYLNVPKSATYLFVGFLHIYPQDIHVEDPTGWMNEKTGEPVDLTSLLQSGDIPQAPLVKPSAEAQ